MDGDREKVLLSEAEVVGVLVIICDVAMVVVVMNGPVTDVIKRLGVLDKVGVW